jgi:TRAP-type C4-dicarboxylate transport system substrate-binding protein
MDAKEPPVTKFLTAALLALLVTAAPARAQVVTIKLGTLAPAGSTWHDILKEMAQRWDAASGGQVKLRVYAGGAQGSEGEMVRKMRVDQLQALSISNVGLHDVLPDPQTMSVPMLFADEAEMECAFATMRPRFEAALEAKGYLALQWSRIGAMSLFCNAPYKTPAEMASAKIFAWEGDPKSVDAMRAAGLRPVVLSSTDIVLSLQTGQIDCLTNVPLFVLTTGVHQKANRMMDLPWGWILGATVVRKEAWEKIPAELRPKLQAIAVELGQKVDAEVRRLNVDAVAAMKKQGLQVVPVDPAPWRAAMEKSWPVVRGGVVPAAVFDEVKAARDACRKKH